MTWNETPRWISPGYRGTLSPLFDQVEFLGYSTQLRFSAVAQTPICNSEELECLFGCCRAPRLQRCL